MKKLRSAAVSFGLVIILSLATACSGAGDTAVSAEITGESGGTVQAAGLDLSESDSSAASGENAVSGQELPQYSGSPYVEINGNVPYFTEAEKTRTDAFENYSSLDSLGRCGVAYANICSQLMPTEKRGSIGSVKPTGWHTVRYDDLIDDKYLFNRCHLVAYCLAGENANVQNLITGTRYMNVEGMLPFEESVARYVDSHSSAHVLYRVTPVFDGSDLVAKGVLMEAYSVEDKGAGIEFCVYCYDVQPGIIIDYATGDSSRAENGLAADYSSYGTALGAAATAVVLQGKASAAQASSATAGTGTGSAESSQTAAAQSSSASENARTSGGQTSDTAASAQASESQAIAYVLNTNTKKFHYPSCSHADDIKAANRSEVTATRESLIAQGYSPCGTCRP